MTSARRLLVLCLPLFVGGDALAHPSARSTFEARTRGAELAVLFRLDEVAIGHVLGPGAADDQVLGYLDAGFTVTADGAPCPLTPASSVRRDAAQGKRIVGALYRCAAPPHQLELASRLFLDEGNPHPIVGTLRHRRAVERYFFNRVERVARADLDGLRQISAFDADQRQFRTATPPAGAYVTTSHRDPDAAPPPPPPPEPGYDLTPLVLALLAIPLAMRGARWWSRRRTHPLPLEETS